MRVLLERRSKTTDDPEHDEPGEEAA
jgi:hypothetical protein